MSLPLGVRFNNPLNVRPSPAELQAGKSQWQGVIAIEHTGAGAFLHFDAPPKGWRCAAGNVIAHYDRWRHNTIASLIGGSGTYGAMDYRPGWAPPQDRNDTAAYIARGVGATGFAANAVLDFHDYAQLKPVLIAMAEVEQGGSPYRWWSDAQIDWGLAQYGVLPPVKKLPSGRIAAGAATAGTIAAGKVLTPSPVALPNPVNPPLPSGAEVQSTLQMLAPYSRWAAVGLCLLIVGGLAWYWWREHQKRRQGLV